MPYLRGILRLVSQVAPFSTMEGDLPAPACAPPLSAAPGRLAGAGCTDHGLKVLKKYAPKPKKATRAFLPIEEDRVIVPQQGHHSLVRRICGAVGNLRCGAKCD